MELLESFESENVHKLLRAARRASRIPDSLEEGWIKSSIDPMKLVRVFKALRLIEGYVICAYLYRCGGNGHGIVFGIPRDVSFPEPVIRKGRKYSHLSPNLPDNAIEDVMEIITGDQSAWSYFSASIFSREKDEFGALWHGNDWSTHTIICSDPWDTKHGIEKFDVMINPSPDKQEWTWKEECPKDWRPRTSKNGEQFIVEFYSYSALGKQTIYKHTDTFLPGTYTIRKDIRIVANGPGGFMF